jgi:hypothetical protein
LATIGETKDRDDFKDSLKGLMGEEAAEQVTNAAMEVTDEAINEDFRVPRDEWIVVKTFIRLVNLMRYGAMGGILSLDWSAVTPKLQIIEKTGEITIDTHLLDGIEIMEKTFVHGMNEYFDKKSKTKKSSTSAKPRRGRR